MKDLISRDLLEAREIPERFIHDTDAVESVDRAANLCIDALKRALICNPRI